MADDLLSGLFTGGNLPITQEELKRRQAVALAIAAQRRKMPTTLGEGMTYLGESVGEALQARQLAQAEREMQARADAERARTPLPGGGGGASPAAAARTVSPAVAAPAAAATTAPQPSVFDTAPAAPNWSGADASDAVDAGRTRMTAALMGNMPNDMMAYASPEVPQANPMSGAPQVPLGGRDGEASPDEDIWARRKAALGGIETGGRRDAYTTVGPPTVRRDGSVDRPYGFYQVMGSNIPSWTQAALGTPMTPQQFLANSDAQDAVFRHRFGQYVDRFGEEGAARAWLGGPGSVNNPGARDVLGTTVGGYGRDYMNRLGGSRRAASPASTQLAALSTGTMSDAPPIIPRIPGVTPDDNEPTPTDIPKSPVLLAQAGPAGLPASVARTLSVPGLQPPPPTVAQPQPAAGAETITRIPGPMEKGVPLPATPSVGRNVEVPPKPEYPAPTIWERQADEILARFKGRPDMEEHAKALADYGKQVRDAQYKLLTDAWTKQLEAGTPASRIELLTKEQQLAEAKRAAEEKNALGGFTLEQMAIPVAKSYEKVQNAPEALAALRDARQLITDGKVFTGADAKYEYEKARGKVFAGAPPDPRIAGTEQFLRAMAPLVAQMRQSLVGSQSISNADREAAEAAANGNITSDPKGMIATFDRIEKAQLRMVIAHQAKVRRYGGDDINRQQKAANWALDDDMENIVPQSHVQRLLTDDTVPLAERVRQFDDYYKTPGLAQKILQRGR